jgi:hypothetical protein
MNETSPTPAPPTDSSGMSPGLEAAMGPSSVERNAIEEQTDSGQYRGTTGAADPASRQERPPIASMAGGVVVTPSAGEAAYHRSRAMPRTPGDSEGPTSL